MIVGRLKSLHRNLKTVAKFAPQQAMSFPTPSEESPEELPIHQCHELQIARDGGLVDIDNALAALDQLILDQIAKEEAYSACLLIHPL